MTSLAAQSDVEALLGRPLTTQEGTYCTALLATASGKAREYIRQEISAHAADVIQLAGNWSPRLVLPQRPVTAVGTLSINGTQLATTGFVWDRFGNVDILSGTFSPDVSVSGLAPQLWGPAGSVYPNFNSGPSWGGPGAIVSVTYDHGYATVPSSILNEVAGMVAAQLASPVGVMSEKIGGYDVRYIRAPGGAMNLTDETKKVFDRFRKRAASTSIATSR